MYLPLILAEREILRRTGNNKEDGKERRLRMTYRADVFVDEIL
jgi:hypothetical protein